MSYEFLPGRLYRMPTHFGPATGPRSGPDGKKFHCKSDPRCAAYAVSFLTDAKLLDAMLPPGFSLVGEPVVTVALTVMTELEWLAGRGYNVLGVTFPAAYQGASGRTVGSFLSVLWESMADPIITGREELGYSKVFAELPEPLVLNGKITCTASWMGYRFMEMTLEPTQQLTAEQITAAGAAAAKIDGTLHYRYIPRVGAPGQADAQYAVLTPSAVPNRVTSSISRGTGSVKFLPARWEDMPTQYMIVNAFASLPQLEQRGASVTHSIGFKDLSDQRIL